MSSATTPRSVWSSRRAPRAYSVCCPLALLLLVFQAEPCGSNRASLLEGTGSVSMASTGRSTRHLHRHVASPTSSASGMPADVGPGEDNSTSTYAAAALPQALNSVSIMAPRFQTALPAQLAKDWENMGHARFFVQVKCQHDLLYIVVC